MLVRRHSFTTMDVNISMKSMNPSLERKKPLVQPQTMNQTNTMLLKGLSLTTSHRGKNTSYERFKFRNITQNKGETFDSFHTRLRALAINCDFHDTDSEFFTQMLL